jgi:hypothetical protein
MEGHGMKADQRAAVRGEVLNRDVEFVNRGEELLLKARAIARKAELELRWLLDKWEVSRSPPLRQCSRMCASVQPAASGVGTD